MKKFIALLLSATLVMSLTACGSAAAPAAEAPAAAEETAEEETEAVTETAPAEEVEVGEEITTEAISADDIEDSMTSEDGTYEVAFVTDVGQLKDKSFNQGTWDGVKTYAYNNGLSYKYYQPANGAEATDDDRYDAMKAAADAGAKVVVAAGFMQGSALEKAAAEFTDVNFIFIDGWTLGMDNVAGIAFKEEQCGYFAGYAVVKEGYEKLGFCGGGGGTNAACCRYGYGFAQGANAAAAEMGKDIEINYSWQYGSAFQASPELQAMVSGWYENGTEIVFACGGSMFESITAAASANDAAVIGVDVDQSFDSDTVVTSALKGIGAAAAWAIAKSYDGTWSEIGNNCTSLGAADGATGLPTATWSLENYSAAEYEAQLQDVIDGKIEIANDDLQDDAITSVEFSNTKINYI